MSLVQVVDHGQVRELRLSRPPVNALDPSLCGAVVEAVAAATRDGVGGLVLAGGPKVFSAGLDVPYLVSLGGDRRALHDAWQAFFQAAQAIATAPMPVAAALAGHAPAGGCVLALCCDYRVMASGPFSIGLNETQVGLVAPDGIQHLLRRTVGAHRAERLLVAGELVQADAALAMGLVDELVEIDHVATRAKVWLEQMLQLPRGPMLETRRMARADLVEALQPARIGLERFIEGWYSDDTQAALRALMARLGK